MEKVKIKDLIRTGQKELDIDAEYTYEDLPEKEPVEVHAHIWLTSTGLNVRGKLHTLIEEPCDRCFEPFEREINRYFEDKFVYESFIDDSRSGEIELHEEDFYDTTGAEGVLDLKDLVYQHLILSISTDRVCNKVTCEIKA